MNFNNAEFLISCGEGSQLPESYLPELVMCGRSNVGKSSLINKICSRKNLARVSSTPGKTTTINFFKLDGVVGEKCMLVDLPGYGYARRSDAEKKRWAELMETYFSSGRNINLALLLLDSRRTPNRDDISMLTYFKEFNIPFAAVLTKCDKLSKTALAESVTTHTKLLKDYSPLGVFTFSVNGPESAETLKGEIAEFFSAGDGQKS